jgi:mRNA interferase MazF
MAYERGAVVLVRFPFTDLGGSKQRPALVVSPPRFNRGQDVIVVAITSSRVEDPGPYDHPLKAWKSCGLLHPSAVRAGKVVTLDASMIRRTLGAIDEADLAAVEAKLKDALGLA